MCFMSSIAFISHPASRWPGMILVGLRASIKSNVKYQACRIAGVSISSTLCCKPDVNAMHLQAGLAEKCDLPCMSASCVNSISSNDRSLSRQPEKRVVHRVTLNRTYEANGTLLIPPK